jgi:peroxiredoxin
VPGFVKRAGEIKAKGVTTIACVSVNDAFVMGAWAKDRGSGEEVMMLADGNAEFTRAIGLELDGTAAGLGLRSQRYAMIVEDGVVRYIAVEDGPGLDVSAADKILAQL